MKKSSLYIHIPFCVQRCTYCDFVTHTNNSANLINKYIDQLCNEMTFYKNNNINLKTIFFGGGTPSVLNINQLEKIFDSINKNFNFKKGIEVTIEVNPGALNKSNLENYIKLGINRLSIGVQSFNQEILTFINRTHNIKDIYDTYNKAREVGFKNISIDVMYGLPKQNKEILEDSLKKVVELNPEHISLYCLDLHDNTPLFEDVSKNLVSLPNEDKTFEMHEIINKAFKENGYQNYEISNWSKEGYESKHNTVYWKNEDYIGIGVSAASYFEKSRFTNPKDLMKYLNKKEFLINNEKQNWQDELEETVFMNLRLIKEGLDIEKINKRFEIDFLDYYKKEIDKLEKKGLLIKEQNNLKISEEAVFVSNEIFLEFIK